MSDIIERLLAPVPRKCEWVMRDYEDGTSEGPFDPLRLEAADTIARLTAELSALQASAKEERNKALEEAAKMADQHAAAIRADEQERASRNGPDPRAPIPARYAAAGEANVLNKAAASIRALMVKP